MDAELSKVVRLLRDDLAQLEFCRHARGSLTDAQLRLLVQNLLRCVYEVNDFVFQSENHDVLYEDRVVHQPNPGALDVRVTSVSRHVKLTQTYICKKYEAIGKVEQRRQITCSWCGWTGPMGLGAHTNPTNEEQRRCGMIWGRRGWRQVGEYDS